MGFRLIEIYCAISILSFELTPLERGVSPRLLRSWVRIPPGAWIFVCCECRVLSGRCLCDEPMTRPEESYRLWYVVVCDLETSRICAPYIYDISSLRVKVGCVLGVWQEYAVSIIRLEDARARTQLCYMCWHSEKEGGGARAYPGRKGRYKVKC